MDVLKQLVAQLPCPSLEIMLYNANSPSSYNIITIALPLCCNYQAAYTEEEELEDPDVDSSGSIIPHAAGFSTEEDLLQELAAKDAQLSAKDEQIAALTARLAQFEQAAARGDAAAFIAAAAAAKQPTRALAGVGRKRGPLQPADSVCAPGKRLCAVSLTEDGRSSDESSNDDSGNESYAGRVHLFERQVEQHASIAQQTTVLIMIATSAAFNRCMGSKSESAACYERALHH
eukprot:6082-Heterococcus_DN1.PRE.5